ncbi:biogenesis of lysosome-related organelles complex-1 subunit 2-domain-containing protein [Thamnocephalis sphaerospora]|uniref:Biogenesis of lysosome-related organelles complex-1 subunit 2-domain-containing protein n=1 Tax=Thamnocephalis sphaerospora TaxID=78915 RepID=A0A4P9XL02_9FUNG|nr:biogenesis of lysosome-related organelles complex-1 subunit 2-domain-containing protein [Thamnocephalis sphaerospora]|eukprot:RKP06455.1 biogenesis of lysosome-related organelles complex-1 subunit 2-domain-containing protein [Thamnocephalis sphaerospora]
MSSQPDAFSPPLYPSSPTAAEAAAMADAETAFSDTVLSDDRLNRLADTAFAKAARQLQGELLLSANDYRLLEEMNRHTKREYGSVAHHVQSIGLQGLPMRKTYQDYIPQLAQMDSIMNQVDKLDRMARELDQYTQELEAKVYRLLKE